MPPSNADRWYQGSPLDPCVAWLEQQARDIARRDPPANGPDQYLNDHGVPHIEAVLRQAKVLSQPPFVPTMLPGERATLYAAVVTHDIGLYRHPDGVPVDQVRSEHAELSGRWLQDLAARADGASPLTVEYAQLLAPIVRAHRRSASLQLVEEETLVTSPFPFKVRGRLVAALLRLADCLDIGQGRTPTAIYRYYGTRIPEESSEHWRAHRTVIGAELDPLDIAIVLHLIPGATWMDAITPYLAIQTELDEIPRGLLRMYRCPRPTVVLKRGDEFMVPGRAFAELAARRDP